MIGFVFDAAVGYDEWNENTANPQPEAKKCWLDDRMRIKALIHNALLGWNNYVIVGSQQPGQGGVKSNM